MRDRVNFKLDYMMSLQTASENCIQLISENYFDFLL